MDCRITSTCSQTCSSFTAAPLCVQTTVALRESSLLQQTAEIFALQCKGSRYAYTEHIPNTGSGNVLTKQTQLPPHSTVPAHRARASFMPHLDSTRSMQLKSFEVLP